MAMTPESFTGNDTYDILVTIYLIIRIILSFGISLLCGVQLFLECRILKKRGKSLIAPRILTLFSLTMFPIFRVLYSAILFKTHDFDYGSLVVYLGMWTTFFIFNIWIWICCVWMQLLYTFFISKEIRLRNQKKVWYYSWLVSGLALLYTILYTIFSAVSKSLAKNFYTAGFLTIIVVFGASLIINGLILSNEMKKHDKKMNNDSSKVSSSVVKIKRLAYTLLFTVVAALLRDLAFLFVKGDMFQNIRHFSAFYTFFLETTQGIIVMVALAEKPINYFKFKRIYVSTRAYSSSAGSKTNDSSKSNDDSRIRDSMYGGSGNISLNIMEGNSINIESSTKELVPENLPSESAENIKCPTIEIKVDENVDQKISSDNEDGISSQYNSSDEV